jgi:hypothetical protein
VGWHQGSLNWEYSPDPGPWRQAECDRFNPGVQALLPIVIAERGDDFDAIDAQPPVFADLDPDEDLKDPKAFTLLLENDDAMMAPDTCRKLGSCRVK